jgi:ComF family protein
VSFLLNRLNDLIYIFYPEKCAGCGKALYYNEKCICSICLLNLPYTFSYLQPESEFNKLFWGKLPVKNVWPLVYFQKKTTIQRIIHQIKYKNNPEPAIILGSLLASKIMDAGLKPNADYLLPIPMHPKKERQRGYNQADYIARGISEVWNIKINKHLVKKSIYTTTQTQKGRYSRFSNTTQVFEAVNIQEIKKIKGIVLIDDVITTGATICAVSEILLNHNPNLEIYVATLAAA